MNVTATTTNMYNEVLTTRGSVKSIGEMKEMSVFEVIIIKPPPQFKDRQISAILCDEGCYAFKTYLKDYRGRYLKGLAEWAG
jgi:hypothetical protein